MNFRNLFESDDSIRIVRPGILSTFYFISANDDWKRVRHNLTYGHDGTVFDLNHPYINYGKLHRTDGPAIIYHNGLKEFWVRGKQISKEEFLRHFDIKSEE